MPANRQWLLDNRPQGEASVSNFKLVTTETPALADGQVLVVASPVGRLSSRIWVFWGMVGLR